MLRVLSVALLLGLAAPLAAQIPAEIVSLEVLPGWRPAEGRHLAALHLRLAPGWKTYWRDPGEVGLAPLFDFAGSEGVSAAAPVWPVPEVFNQGSYRFFGYAEAVTIPLDLAVGSGPARLAGTAEIGVCRDVCVPVTLAFAADLPAGGAPDPRIAAALTDRPLSAEEAGAAAVCAVRPAGEALDLTLRLTLAPLGPEEAVAVETADPALRLTPAVARREGDTLIARLSAEAVAGGPAALDRSALTITVLAGGHAVEISGCGPG
jgi:DsbC/DsbD-like thiol-disulfide interchange protein